MSDEINPDEVVHATITPEAIAATSGDGSEPLPEETDPYDVPNPDEEEPDPGPAPDYFPEFILGDPQDSGDDPEPDVDDPDPDGAEDGVDS